MLEQDRHSLLLQQSHRNTSQPNRLHPSIRIGQGIQLHLHLRSLWPVKRSLVKESLDVLLHEERQLQRQSHAPVVQSCQALREQLTVFRDQRRTPRVFTDSVAL